jgi:hypothetical protein
VRKPDAFALLRHLYCAAQQRYHHDAEESAGQRLHHGIWMSVASSLKRCLTIFHIAHTSLEQAYNGKFTKT